MSNAPAVNAEGEPPVALVNVATRLADAVPVAFVRAAEMGLPMTPAVRTELDVMNAFVVVVVPTMIVNAVVPANAVETFTSAFSTTHADGSAPRVIVTVSVLPVPLFTRRLERHGFRVEAVLGDYRGGPWDERADVWIMLARRL